MLFGNWTIFNARFFGTGILFFTAVSTHESKPKRDFVHRRHKPQRAL